MENNNEDVEDSYKKIDEAMGQFMFLLYIPNTQTRTVEVYIDQGEYHTWYTFNEFYEKIASICGPEEANKLLASCHELGVPFFYDRDRRTIKEITENHKEERISTSLIRKMGTPNATGTVWNTNSIFDSVKDQYLDLVNNIMKGEK